MRTLSEQMQVQLAHRRGEPVGIVPLPDVTVREVESQAVRQRKRRIGQQQREEAVAQRSHLA